MRSVDKCLVADAWFGEPGGVLLCLEAVHADITPLPTVLVVDGVRPDAVVVHVARYRTVRGVGHRGLPEKSAECVSNDGTFGSPSREVSPVRRVSGYQHDNPCSRVPMHVRWSIVK